MRRLFATGILFCALCCPPDVSASQLGCWIGDLLTTGRITREPLGTVKLFRAGREPVGWQECDGRRVYGNSPLRGRMKRAPKIPSDRKGYKWYIRTK